MKPNEIIQLAEKCGANTAVDPQATYGQLILFDLEGLTAYTQSVSHNRLSDTRVNGGALRMALNVLRRHGNDEVADELEKTAIRIPAPPKHEVARPKPEITVEQLDETFANPLIDSDLEPGWPEIGDDFDPLANHPTQ